MIRVEVLIAERFQAAKLPQQVCPCRCSHLQLHSCRERCDWSPGVTGFELVERRSPSYCAKTCRFIDLQTSVSKCCRRTPLIVDHTSSCAKQLSCCLLL